MTRPLTALGVHIFAGGFSVGVREAGFSIAGHLETSPYGVSTAKANFPGLPVFVGRSAWPLADLAAEAAASPDGSAVDLLLGNPPCAIWSNIGITHDKGPGSAAWREDPRAACWWDALRVIEVARPRVAYIESVCQAMATGRPMIDEVARRALALGYSVTLLMISAERLGAPQRRPRFVFALSHGRLVTAPLVASETAGTALSRVVAPGPFTAPRALVPLRAMTKPGGRLADAYVAKWGDAAPRKANGDRAGCPSFLERVVDPDKPALVVAGDRLWHPTEHRRLGIEEYKALCGFPEDFRLIGPSGGHASLLARGLLPPVARWLGETAKRTIAAEEEDIDDRPRVRLLDLRREVIVSEDLTDEYTAAGARAARDERVYFDGFAADEAAAKEKQERKRKPAASPSPSTFIGTTGSTEYLSDSTGARRYYAAVGVRVDISDAPQVVRVPAERQAPAGSMAASFGLSATKAVELVEASLDPPREGERVGAFMKRLLLAGLSGDETVACARESFPESKAKRVDAYCNWNRMKKSGLYLSLPPWRAS